MSEGSNVQFSEREALLFHSSGRPGKIEIIASKPMATQRDLSLAYSPGVAVPVRAIAENPALAYDYTAKGNLVAVISNGTAILGLGNLGALASKPVMEGKAVLFKRFADVDSIDLELDTEDPEAFINAVALMEPSFGGMDRHSAHRDRLAVMDAARGQRDVERRRGRLGVVEEQLEEVAHPVEEQAIGRFRLERQILRHHRRRSRILQSCRHPRRVKGSSWIGERQIRPE